MLDPIWRSNAKRYIYTGDESHDVHISVYHFILWLNSKVTAKHLFIDSVVNKFRSLTQHHEMYKVKISEKVEYSKE